MPIGGIYMSGGAGIIIYHEERDKTKWGSGMQGSGSGVRWRESGVRESGVEGSGVSGGSGGSQVL
ncbi:hypothetical protein Hamer_G012030 [Homarus americanus]|uniref:Uncharacterized protein n=1 Tax=Homarus americanus TaxID=6706 RepID=A0A8J5JK69_HOMAM|nr:hypothetical protein Hamer_G012030 [Homarus americanus]